MTGAEDGSLTREEKRFRGLLWFHAALSVAFAVGYLTGGAEDLGFIPNSVGKDGMFAVLSVLAALHVRRHGWLVLVIALGYAGLIVGQAAALLHGGVPGISVLGLEISPTAALLGWMAVDVLLTAWLLAWWLGAVRARWKLRALHPVAFLSLVALAEVLIQGEREVVPPERIARNVDGYLADLQARSKNRVQLALAALFPLRALSPPARKRALERRFVEDVARRRVLAPLRPYVQAAIRVASQMAYLGYYGDRASWPSIGYTPFAERPGGRPPEPGDHSTAPLRIRTVPPRPGEPRYDAVVVGSGAAGAILAYRFAEAGRRVLVLERGPHVDPRSFSDDEVRQYLELYNEGALQLATHFRFQVLQGMCVGGGTTINNALCLDPPDAVLADWAPRGVDPPSLRAAIGEVRDWLHVAPIREGVTSVAARRFEAAAHRLGLPGRVERMEANILPTCHGCGYCNIGCAYGAKVSMLDGVLPWAQRDFPGRVDVLPRCEATRIVCEGDRAVAVTGVHAGRETVSIAADEIVVAAGAVHSSWLLQRSGLGGRGVGQGLHFNVNSPLTADFPDPVDSFAGVQMSHAYVPDGGVPGYLLETWFNPPATQALAMPGWFDRHFENMRRYRHMAAGGALTGTTEPGRVRATRGGPVIDYVPSRADLARVVEGLKVMGAIFLEAGAERVMPATYAWHEVRDRRGLASLERIVRDDADLLLTSAHPQGGNALGDVVDERFRVRGLRNLHLCDASVFPSSVTVNPQLTVMGLAQLASRTILGPDLPPAERVLRPAPA